MSQCIDISCLYLSSEPNRFGRPLTSRLRVPLAEKLGKQQKPWSLRTTQCNKEILNNLINYFICNLQVENYVTVNYKSNHRRATK